MPRIAAWPALLAALLAASCGGFPGLSDLEYREGYAEGYAKGCVPWPADKARSLAAETVACEMAPPSGRQEYRIGWQAGFRQAAFMASSAWRPLFEPLHEVGASPAYDPFALEEPAPTGLAGGAAL